MLIEEALFSMLDADAAIANIVGNNIFPVTLPQYLQKEQAANPSYPAVVFSLVSRQRSDTHDGPTGLVESQYGFACLSRKYLEAKQLAEAVRLALHGQAAAMQAIYGDDVKGIYLDDEADDYIFDEVESLSLYEVAMTFVIQHSEVTS